MVPAVVMITWHWWLVWYNIVTVVRCPGSTSGHLDLVLACYTFLFILKLRFLSIHSCPGKKVWKQKKGFIASISTGWHQRSDPLVSGWVFSVSCPGLVIMNYHVRDQLGCGHWTIMTILVVLVTNVSPTQDMFTLTLNNSSTRFGINLYKISNKIKIFSHLLQDNEPEHICETYHWYSIIRWQGIVRINLYINYAIYYWILLLIKDLLIQWLLWITI